MSVNIQTSKKAIPRCYAYTTPTVPAHNGWVKIGYTEQDDVETRINQQLKTANIPHKTEWSDIAVFSDGKTYFVDDDFHRYLTKQGIERMKPMPGDKKPPEWFKISGDDSFMQFCKFRKDKGILKSLGPRDYALRDEQNKAVSDTYAYFENHEKGEFLWNAKPRFGKTLAAYDLCKRLKADSGDRTCNIIIVTNRPAIANSWYDDYVKFVGTGSGFLFVSGVSSLKDKPYVLTQQKYQESLSDNVVSCIEFISLQDLKGSIYFGGEYDKLKEVSDMTWDLLVIDEAHEGVDTFKTDIAFTQIKRKYTLHLSGTPFKALANEKFDKSAIFNWTYADEQRAKANWNYTNGRNPYEDLPRLNLFTYQMSEIVRDELKQGIEINGETEEYAFDLNEFFRTKSNGDFVYEESVDKFLDALTKQEKFPFSTPELRAELKHTFWFLDRVDSAKALAKKLNAHPIFGHGEYKVVLAAGDGKLSEYDENAKSYDKVRNAVDNNEKTITLSVGQLTTGITVPEWTGVLMLSNAKSPALYMQAAFRSQNPWRYQRNGELYVKENAYVFDFDPARTLIIFEKFANDLSIETSGGKGDSDARKQNVRELLNFFPVIGEDENGKMMELDAEKVLTIPRKIRSLEVVRRGFMSNFLFQNIANIFNAPSEVIDIISTLPNAPESDIFDVSKEMRETLFVNEDGDVKLPEKLIVGTADKYFGEKIYNITDAIEEKTAEVINSPEQRSIDNIKKVFLENVVEPVMDIVVEKYGDDLRTKDAKQLKKKLEQKTNRIIEREYGTYSIQQKNVETERNKELMSLDETGKTKEQVNEEFDAKLQDVTNSFTEKLSDVIKESVPMFCEDVVREAETKKRERVKESIEDFARDHLRGFARTIPSFLMAYGNKNTTLETFDQIIPNNVFIEVTGISIDQFRFLRDGGDYIDDKTGEEKHYQGKLFDSVVFNDSIKEFLSLKDRLSDYFDDSHTEDIFDYIPPQRTNQIYTPKNIVVKMVDMLEKENPGCFDDPGKTFIDLYMKSGLYISEIVKRLYNSKKIQEFFPDEKIRLKHIFEKQVYGLAPTEIIYRIAISFILGFDTNSEIDIHNFKQTDALSHIKSGDLESYLDTLFN